MLNIFKTLMVSLFKKPATLQYPYKPKENDPLVRGHISINIEECIFCGMCRRKCPTQSIDVKKPESIWSIERFRCIQCNCCVEVCPTKCLAMKNGLTPSSPAMTKDEFCAKDIKNA